MVQVHPGALIIPMTTSKNFTCTADIAGSRLDVFLADKLKITRSQIQKMIEHGEILVNDKIPQKTGLRLILNDKIKITANKTTKKNPDKKINRKKFTVSDIKIIAETPDYLVVEKPVGMLTHSTNKQESDSLAALLVQKYPALKKIGDDPERPGIVHRLDREASGLLVVARTTAMFEKLKEQFKNRTIQKEYDVLVHGRVAKDWDEINFPIDRSGTSERMAAIPKTVKGFDTEEGKEALTEFLIVKRFVNFALLRVTLHTGRMHQIRAHMLAYNHPVVGDPLYFHKKRKPVWDKKCGRLFLHCAKLGFVDLQGKQQEFNSPLPKNLKSFLNELT